MDCELTYDDFVRMSDESLSFLLEWNGIGQVIAVWSAHYSLVHREHSDGNSSPFILSIHLDDRWAKSQFNGCRNRFEARTDLHKYSSYLSQPVS